MGVEWEMKGGRGGRCLESTEGEDDGGRGVAER